MVSSALSPDITPSISPDAPRPPKLLDQVRSRLRTKHYSIRTEDQYVFWIRRFIRFHGLRHPRELGA
ncbi:MAG: phage integrase N-terminal SAM-like domain-containing protein, partial [Rhodocyclaceae bacterium]|nr:phage integrase N-terminal SAM-like domain-containing protein [Rhodocyclaceae bacterium]